MRKRLLLFVAMLIPVLSLICLAANASEFQDYVQQCESELGFNAGDVKAMNCNDGINFAGPSADGSSLPINDYVAYQRVNDKVDLVVACRWLGFKGNMPPNATIAVSAELLIHNRQTGSTCFFSAKNTLGPSTGCCTQVSTSVVSPTNFTSNHPNAEDYWMQPTDLNNNKLESFPGDTNNSARCVGCHVAGPYIASERIAPFLAQFGLLNDGHDTFADMTATKHYHAVGSGLYYKPTTFSAFGAWDSIIFGNIIEDVNYKPAPDCSSACHSIARNSQINSLAPINGLFNLLPSIKDDIAEITADGVMPPKDQYSDYRWINRGNPSGTGDWEQLSHVQSEYPQFYCANPTLVQAHAVGSDFIFAATDDIVATDNVTHLPDKLDYFNLREGLVCKNSSQSDGHQCHDYQTRYICNGKWTDWYNMDADATGNGDFEQRSKISLPCGSPSAIEAQTQVTKYLCDPLNKTCGNQTYTYKFHGANDRLRNFDTTIGFACANADQPNSATCSNYVVRYICPN